MLPTSGLQLKDDPGVGSTAMTSDLRSLATSSNPSEVLSSADARMEPLYHGYVGDVGVPPISY